MARRPRELESNVVYHIYNRRNEKRCLFDSDEEYSKFVDLLQIARQRFPVRLHSYCLMSTHWHLAASAEHPGSLSDCLAWLSTTHAVRYRRRTNTVGLGHVYQGRFGALPVWGIVHYATLIRYIEGNPLTAKVVERAEDWRWSSLGPRCQGDLSIIEPGPWTLPTNWLELVNTPDVKFEMLPALLGQVAAFGPPPLSFS